MGRPAQHLEQHPSEGLSPRCPAALADRSTSACRGLISGHVYQEPLAIHTLDTCLKARGYNLQRKKGPRDKTHVGVDHLAPAPTAIGEAWS